MTKLYKGKTGKIAAAVSFIEEALPFMDLDKRKNKFVKFSENLFFLSKYIVALNFN